MICCTHRPARSPDRSQNSSKCTSDSVMSNEGSQLPSLTHTQLMYNDGQTNFTFICRWKVVERMLVVSIARQVRCVLLVNQL